MISIGDIKKIVDANKDIDICFNSNGAKIGIKGTAQANWLRVNWKDLNADRINRRIKTIREEVSDSEKPSPSFFDSDVESSPSQVGAHVSSSTSSTSSKRSGDKYLAKYCKKLPKKDAEYLKKFYAYAKKEGYLPEDTTTDDAVALCEVWKDEKRKQKQTK
jgi:hypothetical protein